MNNIRDGLLYRVILAIVGIALATNSIINFANSMNYGSLILGVGWLFMAVSWFMQPVDLNARLNLSEIKSRQASLTIGSPLARMFFTFGGLALVITGLTLKLVSAT